MIFKVGNFIFLCGIGVPILTGAHFILWDSRHKEALRQYWINKLEGKPLSIEMTSARNNYFEICACGVAAVMGSLLMLVGYFWEM
jgi:hypothetical protein